MRGNIFSLPVFVGLIFASSSLINFGPIPGAKIQVSLALLCLLYILYREKLLGYVRVDYREDLLFLLLLFVLSTSSLLQPDQLVLKNVTQPVYLAVYYLFYKMLLACFGSLGCSGQVLFYRYYRLNSFVFFLSINMYALGFFAPSIVRNIIIFFNNAGTFDLGGITVGIGDFLPRLTGFSPEPSFWSAAVVLNIAVFFELKYKSAFDYLLLGINAAALGCTFGKTGLLVLVAMMIYLFYLSGRFGKLFVLTGGVAVAIAAVWNISFLYELLMSNESTRQRLDSVIFSVLMFLDRPLIGLGFGGFENLAVGEGKDYRDIFSFHVALLVSGGIAGFILWSCFIAGFAKKGRNVLLFSIIVCWIGMPAYNLPFIWILLAILKVERMNFNRYSLRNSFSDSSLNMVKV